MAPTVFGGVGSAATSSPYGVPLNNNVCVATENLRQWKLRVAGVFSNYNMNVDATPSTSVSMTWRDNGVDAHPTLSIPNGSSGWFKDSSTGYRYAVGDTFGVRQAFSTSAFTKNGYSTRFDADSGTVAFYMYGSASATNPSATFLALGGISATTEDATSHTTMRTAGTAKNMMVAVSSNSNTGTTTVSSRKNSAAGNMTLTVGASTTGLFEDTVNADTLASGDTFGFTLSGNTGTFTFFAGCNVAHSGQSSELIGGNVKPESTNSIMKYSGVLCANQAGMVTESSSQNMLGLDGTLSRMRFNVNNNSVVTNTVVTLRKNGANGNQNITVSASTTGTFEDTTNSDSFTASDLLSVGWINTSLGGLFEVSWMATTMQPYMSPQRFLKRTYLRR